MRLYSCVPARCDMCLIWVLGLSLEEWPPPLYYLLAFFCGRPVASTVGPQLVFRFPVLGNTHARAWTFGRQARPFFLFLRGAGAGLLCPVFPPIQFLLLIFFLLSCFSRSFLIYMGSCGRGELTVISPLLFRASYIRLERKLQRNLIPDPALPYNCYYF